MFIMNILTFSIVPNCTCTECIMQSLYSIGQFKNALINDTAIRHRQTLKKTLFIEANLN